MHRDGNYMKKDYNIHRISIWNYFVDAIYKVLPSKYSITITFLLSCPIDAIRNRVLFNCYFQITSSLKEWSNLF